MKAKMIGFISVLLFLSVIFSVSISADEIAPSPKYIADAFALYDIDEEVFLIEDNLNVEIRPSSTVKIMSGLIVCELLEERADDTVFITSQMINGVSGKNMGLHEGVGIKIKDLMFAAYSCGYNDAVMALSVIAAGSADEMIELMNARAKELFMYSTNYTNVTGLDATEMKTTLRDIIRLSVCASQNELYLEVSSAYNHTFQYSDGTSKTVYGSNELLNKNSPYYCASAKGMNSGATDSGACVVTYGEAKGRRLIAVALGCADDTDTRFALMQNSLDWGYKHAYVTLAEKNDLVGEIKVEMSQTDGMSVDLVLSEALSVFLDGTENKERIRYTLITDSDSLTAPVKKGDIVGKYVVWYGNDIRGIADVTVSENVEKSGFLAFLGGVEGYLTGRAFIATIIILAVSLVLFLLLPKLALLNRQSKRKYVKTRGGFDLKNKK